MLSLPESLLLLSLDEGGHNRAVATGVLNYAVAGAVLFELHLRQCIRVVAKQVEVLDATPTGDACLDAVLEALQASTAQRSIQYWILTLSRNVRMVENVASGLVARGILREEQNRVLGLIPVRRYPTEDPNAGADLRDRLYSAIMGDLAPDVRDRALIALAHRCALLAPLFLKEERQEAKMRILALLKAPSAPSADFAGAVQALDSANAAVIASMAATIAVCSS
ncbi:MAG TPA: GPP34 family phosphoprotein [Chthonomonadaceae bacterium]|nr:GPP34 family phosphoprotein [Chthonomonadaceae bacterium]